MLILIPILVLAAIGFGVDPVHFGVMMLNLILGAIHPPSGVALFITSRIGDISFEKMSLRDHTVAGAASDRAGAGHLLAAADALAAEPAFAK